jgi:hypothetical protein
MIRAPLPERLTPLAARLGLRPFYGDIHNHCALSYGHGTLEDALANAALQLDFVSITGHAHWPDMPVDDPSVAHIVDFHVKGFDKLRRGWHAHFATLKAADAPGRLTVFPGYEIHSSAFGDYTIVLADLDPAPLELADDPATLKAALRRRFGDRAFAFPHHIGYRLGARGINWDAFDPELSPFVEMISMHGCAEASETDRPYLHSMGPVNGRSTMRHGLAAGHVFGVVGNTDHHSGFPGSFGHGRMALYAERHDRDALWSAMRARRTNALTGANVHLLAAIDGAVQGETIPPGRSRRLEIEAVAGGFIDCIDVIRNGRLFHRVTPALAPDEGRPDAGGLEALLHLELGWGARGSRHRWDVRLALDGGEILAVEPRLRGAEIVSPLEGRGSATEPPRLSADATSLRFEVTSEANPNNATPAMQGLMLRVRVGADATVRARLSGTDVAIPVARLLEGAVSGNLGPIDSPAFQFHPLVPPRHWRWSGAVPLGELAAGETLYLRLRQQGGQTAWTSPFFVTA